MVDSFEHLNLPFVPDNFLRTIRPRGRGPKKPDRDEYEASQEILQSFDNIQQKHKERKQHYKDSFNPDLIFKIEVNQNVSEDSFRINLRRAGIKVISPSPDNKGFWVVFTEDEELLEFKRRLSEHVQEDKYDFLYAVENLSDIPPEEKVGESLQIEPFGIEEKSYLNIEIWRMEDSKLEIFIDKFDDYISKNGGEITDLLTTKNFCLMRVDVNNQLYIDILEMSEVRQVERIPRIKIETILNKDLTDLEIRGKPSEDSTGILVVDSGILSSHPLLENAVGDEIALATSDGIKISEDSPSDDVGHGTQVAGIALYGDLQKCISDGFFSPEIWIFSAKVMYKDEYGDATFDEKQLLEHQLESAVKTIVRNYPKCKVINLSLGYAEYRMFGNKNQFNLASLVDELSKELNLIFVISIGNFNHDVSDDYPHYLLNESIDVAKIIDPATSALAITVGALSKHKIHNLSIFLGEGNEDFEDYPSPITRVGLGYQGMIKPELVEYGGGGFGKETDLITINSNWIKDGRLFTLAFGTSMSAPKVSHYIAKLINKFPTKSLNLIKAMLLSSASIPSERPSPLSELNITSNETDAKNLLKIYGYGKPDFEKALNSNSNRVLLMRENSIQLNKFHVYEIYLPKDFAENRGSRSLSVTLVYDPPVNKNRIDYLGVKFETHLFKNMDVNDVIGLYQKIEIETLEGEIIPEEHYINRQEIKLHPGSNLRKKGVHQKSTIEYRGKPSIDVSQPLILVVISQNRWVQDEDYEQDYAVVVSVEYSEQVDIYTQIRLRNQGRIRVSA